MFGSPAQPSAAVWRRGGRESWPCSYQHRLGRLISELALLCFSCRMASGSAHDREGRASGIHKRPSSPCSGFDKPPPPTYNPHPPPIPQPPHLEGAHECLVDAHHGAGVLKLAAVVGRRENGHQLALGKELVALLDHLAKQVWRRSDFTVSSEATGPIGLGLMEGEKESGRAIGPGEQL
jgi:hypothetical protein